MNIAILTPAWPAGATPNGIATYYKNLVPAMAALGHKIIVLTFNHDAENHTQTKNIHVYPLPEKISRLTYWRARAVDKVRPGHLRKTFGAAQIIHALEEALREHKIDILQMEESLAWHDVVRKRLAFPVVARLHGPHFLNASKEMGGGQSPADKYRLEEEGKALVNAVAVTAPSDNVMNQTKKFYDLNWKHQAVFPNPVFAENDAPRWSLDRCNKNEILFVGRFDRHKGGDILLEAFAALAGKLPDVRLVFAGPDRGIVDETGVRRHLKHYLEDLPQDIRARVTTLGQLSRSDIKALRQKAFVTVVSSRYETFGNVVIEAMACGAPIVATNTGGIAEIIEADQTGLLAPPGDAKALAAKLEQAFAFPEQSAAMGEKAYKVVRERFAPEKIAKDHISFFERVIADQAT